MQGEDRQLIEAYLRGDHDAHQTLDRWMTRAAWPYRGRLREDWEDLLATGHQEVFARLQRGEFKGTARLKTWVWRILAHRAIDLLRRRRPQVDLDEVSNHLESIGVLAAGGEETAGVRDLAAKVMAEISADCRQLWAMVYSGFSYAEMAAKLGAQAGSLRVKVRRCRQKAIELRDRWLGQQS